VARRAGMIQVGEFDFGHAGSTSRTGRTACGACETSEASGTPTCAHENKWNPGRSCSPNPEDLFLPEAHAGAPWAAPVAPKLKKYRKSEDARLLSK
jgi:hypothetical protein